MIQINARKIYTPFCLPAKSIINVKHGKIIGFGEDSSSNSLTVFDLTEYDLVPGLVELQINGAFGVDFTQDPTQIFQVGKRLTELGVTIFLPTIITSPLSSVQKAMQVWKEGTPQDYNGAAIPGFHFEGPFINPEKKGAHRQEFIKKPAMEDILDWKVENGVRLVTVAPEIPGVLEIISLLSARGVIVSAGHSMATLDQMQDAVAAGIACGTHLFNAMRPLDHRQSGLLGLLLTNDELKVGLIVDGTHLAPEIVKLAFRAKGEKNIFLVSDAMAALGLSPGEYELAGRPVIVNETSAHLEDGTLAGSILTPAESLRNFQAFSGCTFEQALQCWTTNPADLMGFTGHGRLEIGLQADLVALDDHGRVAATMINGDWVYIAPWAKITSERIN
ncbi:MAG: N-acetylglucosamine-6-phosphate deacetylase [Chloroflexi bacterium HGW-Chloroflexi-8]|nr:MAG: N-acetylglucosamine-6-phosphate deacetylase [Chloroflexi bacterium HGW-Chloroflexi-8]